ncbi:DUF2877 domain-containing protein [Amycolatopsis sp. NPDC004079]|uniref:DUF2877 domain-containing protein n=1 Tax=Amycolatopsis sp. NPDC004079 TaxID=3154549 RepID=UPI0033A9EA3A
MHATAVALSMDAVVAERVREGALLGEVHSVFRRVLNVVTQQDQLVAFGASTVDDAPWTIRVDVDGWCRHPVQAGAPAVVTAQGATFGATSVKFRNPSIWYAKEIPLTLDRAELAARARLLDALLTEHGVPGGMLEGGKPDPFRAAVGIRLRQGQTALTQALRRNDAEAARKAAEGLVGLGPGLTPAGDDFLSGLALVAAQPGSRTTGFPRLSEKVLARTTLLSATTLREARTGRARESLLDLLRRLLEPGSGTGLAGAVARVAAIGHTSGTDLLSGVAAGLHLESEMRGSV